MKTRFIQVGRANPYQQDNLAWGRVLFILLLWCTIIPVAQAQIKQWDKTFGGSENDNLTAIQQTSYGGIFWRDILFPGSDRQNSLSIFWELPLINQSS
jgi:hypothetical protein